MCSHGRILFQGDPVLLRLQQPRPRGMRAVLLWVNRPAGADLQLQQREREAPGKPGPAGVRQVSFCFPHQRRKKNSSIFFKFRRERGNCR